MTGGFRLGRLFGIELRVDWGLFIVFWLVTFSLGAGLFPQRHPDWSWSLSWSLAMVAAVLFFASVLVHELSHALIGRAYGIPISSITLFIFGGVAHMEREPGSPKAELFMAGVGPLVSILLGAAFTWLGLALAGPALRGADDPLVALSRVGPWATLFLWLGPINVLLGLFNLVPGFPLDGGRVLRALFWAITKDLTRATRWASVGGQIVGWLLIALGVLMMFGVRVPFFGRGLLSGVWLAFIGWFLNSAAIASYRQVVVRRLLHDVPVRRLMRRGTYTVSPVLSVQTLVDDYFMATEQRAFPVVERDRLVGLVCLQDVRKVSRGRWPVVQVAEIMTPLAQLTTIGPDEDVAEALKKLTAREVDQLPVVEDGLLRGLLRRGDIMRWLELTATSHEEPHLSRA